MSCTKGLGSKMVAICREAESIEKRSPPMLLAHFVRDGGPR